MSKFIMVCNFLWQLEAQQQQRLAWEDAAQARIDRARANALAMVQHENMLRANPSGMLGNARLNDREALIEAGLL